MVKARVRRAPPRRPRQPAAQAAKSQRSHDTANVPLEKRIGEVLKQLRLEANLTLADLSTGSRISSAMLSRIENGMATASLDALERLCLALGIGLSDLFKRTDGKKGTAQLVKRSEQMEVVRVGTKYGYTYKLLSYDKGPKKLFDPFFIEMDKKSQSYPRFSHPGTEFIYMLQGRVEYRFGDLTYLLEPGDAFTFSGDVVHGPERLLDEHARFLSIIMYSE
ncbi:XRE family transcriptional regulator [Hyphomicrobium sp. LHD-15]|uniref:helix-turn-helix domain-containing protein n=1 Tax=Hyphomicrobium sp. LHD-15 TaxID=3072142 RepID=UPI00280D27D6|nr:XRE family transcriptional regulator [Hyphomicrobium sp. LHD-15]MDQ8700635.1 XRE family transcriptional regulator [Hyphomicrobium sp. LHD-15]